MHSRGREQGRPPLPGHLLPQTVHEFSAAPGSTEQFRHVSLMSKNRLLASLFVCNQLDLAEQTPVGVSVEVRRVCR